MHPKEVKAKVIRDSRGSRTIEISVNSCRASAPGGKSTGKYEAEPYKTTAGEDADFINKLKEKSLPEINCFDDLEKIEKLVSKKIGANTLFAFEAGILKALAKSQKKELFEVAGKGRKIPALVSNIIGGGAHSKNLKKPDFQEFLVIGTKKTNFRAYAEVRKLIRAKKKNDENAWKTQLKNEEVLEVMKFAKLRIGIDAAASQFYRNKRYYYKNPGGCRTRREQIEYIIELIRNYGLDYVEDPLQEDDFSGFAEILRQTNGKCLIVGDDLTATNPARTKRAIQTGAVNAVIIKPNQIGSLLKSKEVIELCRSNKIKTIMSHRSGETMDDAIADLAAGWACDMLKIPVAGRERLSKIERLAEIGRKLK